MKKLFAVKLKFRLWKTPTGTQIRVFSESFFGRDFDTKLCNFDTKLCIVIATKKSLSSYWYLTLLDSSLVSRATTKASHAGSDPAASIASSNEGAK